MLPTTLFISDWSISRGFFRDSSQRCASSASSSRSCFHCTAVTRVFLQLVVQSAASNAFSPALQRFITDRAYRTWSTCAAIDNPVAVRWEAAVADSLSRERSSPASELLSTYVG